MIKPDGWTRADWREVTNKNCYLQVLLADNLPDYKPDETKVPVCLVDPKLLDWVEKAKDAFMIDAEEEWAEDLLSELEAICPSGVAAKAALMPKEKSGK